MSEFNNLSEDMKRLLNMADGLDWWWRTWIEHSQNDRIYAEIGKHSLAGEDFYMIIDFDKDNQVETFLEDLREYAENFDVEEHAEICLESLGKGGCHSSRKELLQDAEGIKAMIEELLEKLEHPESEELELSDDQAARNDEIYNAIFDMCKVVAGNDNLEWDMYYIGEIAELTANLLINRGEKVRFPAVVTDTDGKQHIEEFYEPEEEA